MIPSRDFGVALLVVTVLTSFLLLFCSPFPLTSPHDSASRGAATGENCPSRLPARDQEGSNREACEQGRHGAEQNTWE